jgi:transposase
MADGLFDREEFRLAEQPAEQDSAVPAEAAARGKARLRVPQREQVEMRYASLDELLPGDHPARAVWELVGRLDLSAWLVEVQAVEGVCGRNATDPRLLLALWVYATVDGVASARELARRCELHLAYQWLCGTVTVNHHLLSDFRAESGPRLDDLLTQLVAGLLSQGLVTLNRVAQDGMRVRASAGRSSFRRRGRLRECLQAAREQVETLKQLADSDPQQCSAQQQAARQRAAAERAQRLEAALAACDEVEQKRRQSRSRHKDEPKGSSTDPEARIMQMADGGYRPAYNVQFATDVASGLIVGVDVTNSGSDNGQLRPMAEQLLRRYGKSPHEYLADGGFMNLQDLDHLETEHQCLVYLPLKDEDKQRAAGKDPAARTRRDTNATAAWRVRMQTDAAKAVYKLRAQSAEWVNAVCRNHNLWRLPVRGKPRCKAVALLHALAHNLLHSRRRQPSTR